LSSQPHTAKYKNITRTESPNHLALIQVNGVRCCN